MRRRSWWQPLRMLRLGRTDPLALVAETHARPRTRGNPLLRRVVERLDGRFGRTRSVAEIFALVRLLELGYREVQVNVRRTLSSGRNVELDVLIGDRIDLEIQSDLHHGTALQRQADAARRRDLEADGYIVGELWARELHDRARVVEVVDDLRRAADRTRGGTAVTGRETR